VEALPGNLMWPLAMAGDVSRCLLMICESRNGMLSRKPRLAACRCVCSGGQKNAWCMYFTWFWMFVIVWILWAQWGARVAYDVFVC
jgi:hypothetical protein